MGKVAKTWVRRKRTRISKKAIVCFSLIGREHTGMPNKKLCMIAQVVILIIPKRWQKTCRKRRDIVPDRQTNYTTESSREGSYECPFGTTGYITVMMLCCEV